MKKSANEPLRVGIIGLGGFAGAHHEAVRALEDAGACRLVCTCDPRLDAFYERRRELNFAERKVRVFPDYLEMLDACRNELDIVTIPTPVHLHAPMHRACAERGLAVYLEKPPTLDWMELEEMLAVEGRARLLTNVGFSYIVDPQRQALKRRLVAGEFGAVKKVSVFALWPRTSAYYARAGWAGRLMLDGRLVLDSCLGNGIAHYAHNALFWCGTEALWAWGRVKEAAAELYRAHDIEGADTVFLQAVMDGGADLAIAMSHACTGPSRNEERVECGRATIVYLVETNKRGGSRQNYTIHWRDGRVETGSNEVENLLLANLRAYFDYLRGTGDRPLTRLADCRPFVHLNGLAYLAARRIGTVPRSAIERTSPAGTQGISVAIQGLDGIFARFLTTGAFPSAQAVPWAAPGGRAEVADLPRLLATVEEMALERVQE
ncbi:MAG: Gfo/Idh/MocA family protein [Bacteroidota bacterium]